jgi:hypothetical protein
MKGYNVIANNSNNPTSCISFRVSTFFNHLRLLNSAIPESLLSTERPSIGSILSSSFGMVLFSSLGEITSSAQEEKDKKK